MGEYEKKKVEIELRKFTAVNFIQPSECRNLEQTRYYVRELCLKIEELELEFNYVPSWAYTLLAQYNATQNRLLLVDFKKSYS